MAREQSGDASGSDRRLLDRRSYLRLAGAAAASVATAPVAATDAAGAADYDTITVPAGETREITVGDGETLENLLVDVTADGARAFVRAMASDWVIRNVAIRGTHPGRKNILTVNVTEPGATGLVENVYLGDGAVPGTRGGIYVVTDPAHRGELTFRRLHCARMTNNGLYGSSPGYKGQSGVVHVEDSYFESNNIANIRLGTAAGTSHVRNSTVVVNDDVPPCDVNCSDPGAVVARGVWAWEGEVALHDCDIRTNGFGPNLATEDGTITQENTRVGSDADTTPPDGVPMTPEEAASGARESSAGSNRETSSGDDGSDGAETNGESDPNSLPNRLVVDGSDAPKHAGEYEVAVSGDLAEDSESGSVNAYDSISDGTATGRVVQGVDAYRFSGEVTHVELQGSATVDVQDGAYEQDGATE